jgi:hypothetical protein
MQPISLRSLLPGIHTLGKVLLFGGCLAASVEASESLIAKYKSATCLPLETNPRILPRGTRSWNATVTLKDGSKVRVNAATMPGGRVTVTYLSSEGMVVAANAGDYVYPYDIRIDSRNDRLYIAASGLAGGIWMRTVLFEYDLRERRQTAHRGVKDKDMPSACPGPAETDR